MPELNIPKTESLESIQNRETIVEGIAKGERAILEESVLEHNEAKQKMRKWLD